MSPSAAVWLTDVFLIVSGQQRRNQIYQALIHTQYFLVDQFIDGLDPNMKKNKENHQLCFKVLKTL